MKNKLKQLIALILAMSMCLSLLSANVWAAEESDPFVDEDASIQSSEGEGSADELGQAEDTSPNGETESAEMFDEEPEDSEPELEVQASKSGKCGKNLTWSLDSKGTLTIQGKGKMSDFENNPPWNNYLSTIKKVVIKSGVTSIGAYAFVSSDEKNFPQKLEEVSMPSTVTRIGDGAFGDIGSLKTVNFPEGLTYVGTFAFMGCQLTNISLPNSVITIGDSAFAGCAIKKITIPSSVKKMGKDVFGGCEKLEQVIFAEGSTLIGDAAFSYCEKLSTVSIPNSLTTVKEDAFLGCKKLTSVTIPRGVTSIGKHAFGYQFDEDENYILIKGFSITGYAGSVAESYAKNNKIKFVTKKYAPSVNGWGFGNYRETISEEIFYRVYDRSKIVNKILFLKKKDKEHALCQGMAFTSALSFIGNPAISSWGKLSAKCEHDFKYTDKYSRTSSEINMTLNEYVQAMWLYQFSKEAQKQESKNKNKYYEIIEKTENFYRTGKNPIVVIIKGSGSGTVQIVGHILVPYRVEHKENEIRLYVYDCNKFEEDVADNQYITLRAYPKIKFDEQKSAYAKR